MLGASQLFQRGASNLEAQLIAKFACLHFGRTSRISVARPNWRHRAGRAAALRAALFCRHLTGNRPQRLKPGKYDYGIASKVF
jgi:hypothetical protein